MKIKDNCKDFLDILASLAKRENQQIYIVGGALRDSLTGKSSADYDFTSRDAPRLAKQFAHYSKLPLVRLDDTPGRETFRVVIDKTLYFDFSRQQGNTLAEDLMRRDFTFNAMAITLKDFLEGNNNIIDPHHGINDLRNRIVRVLPGDIFADDPLRMVRAFRFASTLNFTIEKETLEKITKYKSQLSRIASERIYYELSLFLSSRETYPHLILMDKSGLLVELFPELSTMILKPDWKNTLSAFKFIESMDALPNPIGDMAKSLDDKVHSLIKLATILFCLPDVTFILKRLRASNAEISFIENTIRGANNAFINIDTFNQCQEAGVYRFVKQCGSELIPALLLALASYYAKNNLAQLSSNLFTDAVLKVYDFYLYRYLPAQTQSALLNGDDLINHFKIAPSPIFKLILDQIEESRVLGTIKNRKEAEELAKRLIDNN
jgi:tRNA nucleotidyltransferase/poly(A) polymerase